MRKTHLCYIVLFSILIIASCKTNNSPFKGFYTVAETTDNGHCNPDSIIPGDCNFGGIYFTEKGNVICSFACVDADSVGYSIGNYEVYGDSILCSFTKDYRYANDENGEFINKGNQEDTNWKLMIYKANCQSNIKYWFTPQYLNDTEGVSENTTWVLIDEENEYSKYFLKDVSKINVLRDL